MPCLLGLAALSAPRFLIIMLVLFTDYIERAYDSLLWPLIGFFVAPTTTLAWAWAENTQGGRNLQGWQLVVVVVAALLDLGVIGGGRSWVAGRRR